MQAFPIAVGPKDVLLFVPMVPITQEVNQAIRLVRERAVPGELQVNNLDVEPGEFEGTSTREY